MNKHKWLLLLLAIPPTTLVALGLWYWHDHQEYCYKLERGRRITRENFDRILREGMNRAQVEALLGPPGDFRTGHVKDHYPALERTGPSPVWDVIARWSGDEGFIGVRFDKDGRQLSPGFAPPPAPDAPWWRQLLDHLRL